jgi:enoyl-CoA hydratase/carnithine racemase
MVLTGAGGAFCSGADLSDPNGPASALLVRHFLSRMRRLGDVALALHRLTKPTIAKVDGFAVGPASPWRSAAT